jgi:hypothetical protein
MNPKSSAGGSSGLQRNSSDVSPEIAECGWIKSGGSSSRPQDSHWLPRTSGVQTAAIDMRNCALPGDLRPFRSTVRQAG